MADDSTLIVFGSIAIIIWTCLIWFIGRMFDPTYRTKRLRQLLRTNTIMIAFITKDRKTIDRITVNIDNARVKVGNSVIVVDKSRIYREDKPQAGFVMNKSHIKWDEGVPTLYVYADSLKPADFFDEPSKVSAEDVGTVLISFVRIEIMKGLEAIKKYEMFFFIIIGLVILVGVGLYVVYGEVQTTHAVANACVANTQLIMDRFGITANQTLNNTLMVK